MEGLIASGTAEQDHGGTVVCAVRSVLECHGNAMVRYGARYGSFAIRQDFHGTVPVRYGSAKKTRDSRGTGITGISAVLVYGASTVKTPGK